MNKGYKIKNNKIRIHFLVLGSILLSTFFLAIGYASINSVAMDIEGTVSAEAQEGVFITDVIKGESISATSIVNQFYQTMLNSEITLSTSDPNSSVSYTITVYNSTDEVYVFDQVKYSDSFYSNTGITFELNGLSKYDQLLGKQSITFSITFKYLNNQVATDNILTSCLNFKFDLLNSSITTNTATINIYNAYTTEVPIEITNGGNSSISLNLTINNQTVASVTVAPSETKTIANILSDANILKSLVTNQTYTVMINQTSPYTSEIESSVKVKVIPTMTNYDYGFKSAGTSTNPYIIHKIEDLVRLAIIVNSGTTFEGQYIALDSDLNMKTSTDYYNSSDTSFGNINNDNTDGNTIMAEMAKGTGFMGIGVDETNTFKGNFNGNNKTLSKVYINNVTAGDRAGIFGYIDSATIRNLTVDGIYIILGDGGGLVGYVDGTSKIINCHNKVNITNTDTVYSVGGLIGTLYKGSNTTISNCSNTGTIKNGAATAGLVGFCWAATVSIENSYNLGAVYSTNSGDANSHAAGLIVKDSGTTSVITIRNCYNSGSITGTYRVGGLISRVYGTVTIDSSYNSGAIVGTQYVGGILGLQTSGTTTITNTYNVGTVTGTSNTGGIIGYASGGSRDISSAYYLNSTASGAINGGTTTNARTEAIMKTEGFVTTLGSNFVMDTTNINNGYPILSWQVSE